MEYKYTFEGLRKIFNASIPKKFHKEIEKTVKDFLDSSNTNIFFVCDSVRPKFIEEFSRINRVPPVIFLTTVLDFVNTITKSEERYTEDKMVHLAAKTTLPVLNDNESVIKRFINFALNVYSLELQLLGGINNLETRKNVMLTSFEVMTVPAYRFMLEVLDAYIDSMNWGFDRSSMMLNIAAASAILNKEKVDPKVWTDAKSWKRYCGDVLNLRANYVPKREFFKEKFNEIYADELPHFFDNLKNGEVNSNRLKAFIRGIYFNSLIDTNEYMDDYNFIEVSNRTPDLKNTSPFKLVPEKKKKEAAPKKPKKKKPFNLTGRKELNSFFNESIIDVIENGEAYKRFGIGFPEPFILEGPPGCGKTFAVTQLEKYLDIPSYHITSSNVGSSFIHETAKKIEGVFEEAKENERSMVIIDEMESFMPNRGNARSDQHFLVEETNSFLKCLQTAQENNILVVGMTNFIERVDPAILRSGRMGTHIKVEWPSEEEITEVLKYEFKKRPHERMSLKDYASRFLERPLSDVAAAVRRAAMSAARRRAEKINKKDLEDAIDFVLPKEKKEERRVMGFSA